MGIWHSSISYVVENKHFLLEGKVAFHLHALVYLVYLLVSSLPFDTITFRPEKNVFLKYLVQRLVCGDSFVVSREALK